MIIMTIAFDTVILLIIQILPLKLGLNLRYFGRRNTDNIALLVNQSKLLIPFIKSISLFPRILRSNIFLHPLNQMLSLRLGHLVVLLAFLMVHLG